MKSRNIIPAAQNNNISANNIEVVGIKCGEYIEGSGIFIAAFKVLEKSSGHEIKDKFNFDISSEAPAEKTVLGYAFYIFNINAPKNGRFTVEDNLLKYKDKIMYEAHAFLNR